MPFDIESSNEFRSPARLCSDCDVKKLIGLSRAELTFLPVARRFWVVCISCAVFCSESRFARTPAERVIQLAICIQPFWFAVLASEHWPSFDGPARQLERSHRECNGRKNSRVNRLTAKGCDARGEGALARPLAP